MKIDWPTMNRIVTMGVNAKILIEEADCFSAPDHLVPLYNSGQISYEQMAILSAKHYMRESDSAVEQQQILSAALQEKAEEAVRIKAKLLRSENNELALAMARNEIADLEKKIVGLSAYEGTSIALAGEVEALEVKLTESKLLENAGKLAVEDNELLQSEINNFKTDISQLTSELNRKKKMIATLEGRFLDVNNSLKGAENRIARLAAELEQKKEQLKIETDTVVSLQEQLRENNSEVEEARDTLSTVAVTLEKLHKSNLSADKENRLLALYINSHSTAPMMETECGHQLRALMLDQNQISSDDGKEAILGNTALFQWSNPNGYACLVALSSDGKSIIMPSLADRRILGADCSDATMMIADQLTNYISPDDKYHDDIAAHIKGFDVKEFKKTMLKAFSRATYLTNETGHLLIEAEKGLTQSELIEMKGMIKGKADSLTATRQQTKRTLRPKAKSGTKKRKKRN